MQYVCYSKEDTVFYKVLSMYSIKTTLLLSTLGFLILALDSSFERHKSQGDLCRSWSNVAFD
jgi:hypothetical protein